VALFTSVGLAGGLARANGGDPDPTFGTAGLAIITQLTRAVAALPFEDGGLVVAGSRPGEFVLVRLRDDGTIDDSFGAGGVSAIPVGSTAEAVAAVRQPDGRVVVVGNALRDIPPSCPAGCATVVLARWDAGGDVDTSFGTDGLGVLEERDDCAARTMRRQSDGKLVVAGGCASAFALIRFAADGMLDESFGTGGVTTVPGRIATDMVIQADGAMVMVGGAPRVGIRLVRVRADGTIDPAFGLSNGVTDVASDGWQDANALVERQDGRLLVAGSALVNNDILNGSFPAFAVIGFTHDGTMDPVFGTHVSQLGLPSSQASAVVENGRGVVLAGRRQLGFDFQFGLLRFGADGLLDDTFGTFGTTETDVPGGNDDDPRSLSVQSDGVLVVTGTSGGRGVVARYTAPDLSDGSSTTTTTTISSTTSTLPCATPRCVLDVALGSTECKSEQVPGRIAKKLERALNLIDRATSADGRAGKLRRKALKALAAAGRAARKAAKGSRPRLSTACADAIGNAADRMAMDLLNG